MSIYKINPVVKVLAGTPINRDAARVTRQRYCSPTDPDATKEELNYSLQRLNRKHALMKSALKIKNKSQHANVVKKFNAGKFQKLAPRRIIKEYVQNGLAIQLLARRLSEINKEDEAQKCDGLSKAGRKKLGAIENVWKDEHPGWVWTGKVVLAPNGMVWDRNKVIQELKVQDEEAKATDHA